MKITGKRYDPYILIIEDALDPSVCDKIIELFEQDEQHHVHTHTDGFRSFKEVNITTTPGWEDVQKLLGEKALTYTDAYKQVFNLPDYAWQEPHAFEQFRMKRYLPNDEDCFGPHVDVGDHDSARRFLVFFWYLNDVEEGGETVFLFDEKIAVKPKKGSLMMFPPMWTHPHEAMKPISGPKFIIGGYLHYI